MLRRDINQLTPPHPPNPWQVCAHGCARVVFNNMNSAIFYASKLPRKELEAGLPGAIRRIESKGHEIYVRMEIMKGMDAIAALNHARPHEGETVLNSIEL